MVIPAPVWDELRFGRARLPPSRQREAIEHHIQYVMWMTVGHRAEYTAAEKIS